MGHNREQKKDLSPRSREHWESDVTFLNRARAVELVPSARQAGRSPLTAFNVCGPSRASVCVCMCV